MMKKITAVALAVLAACTFGMLLGCSASSAANAPRSVAVVYAQRMGSATDPTLAAESVRAAVTTHGYVDIVTCDGSPKSAVGGGTIMGSDAPNESNRKAEEQAQTNRALGLLMQSRASSPEADLAAAISYAGRSLLSAPDGIREIVVVDPGVSTAGDIDFTRGIIDAEPAAFAEYLESNNMVPDLSHVDRVIWYGFGDVADDQEALPGTAAANMREIYRAYLIAAGVGEVVFDGSVGSSPERADGLPHVTPVDMPETPAFGGVGTTVKLTQSTLSFVDGHPVFVDDASAKSVLAEFAQALAANPSLHAVVRGYTASNPTDPNLSQLRADRVADELSSLGASSAQLEAIGMGVGPIDDHGGSVEELAAQNRYVEIAFE